MIADPLAILEEDEIHLGFSNSFRDSKSGFDETMLHDVEALVARLPAHLPSDIQKVTSTAVEMTRMRCPDVALRMNYELTLDRYARYLSLSSEYIGMLLSSHQKVRFR